MLSERLGDRVRRLPDGETGPRADWIVWQYPVLIGSRPKTRNRQGAAVSRVELAGLEPATFWVRSRRSPN